MRVGLALPAYDIETGRAVSVPELAEMAVRAEELGFDSATYAIIAPTPRQFARFEPQRIEEIARSLEVARRAENV